MGGEQKGHNLYLVIEGTTNHVHGHIKFQDGPVRVAGVNGCQAEDVIDVLLMYLRDCNHRLACPETDTAIMLLNGARSWLQKRKTTRVAQGVEGTEAPHDPHTSDLAPKGMTRERLPYEWCRPDKESVHERIARGLMDRAEAMRDAACEPLCPVCNYVESECECRVVIDRRELLRMRKIERDVCTDEVRSSAG